MHRRAWGWPNFPTRPDLSDTSDRVASVVQQEEKAFFATIDDGLQRIERIFESMEKQDRTIIDGSEVAELYQTFGVPAELFESLAAERGFTFDWKGFQNAMEAHGEASGEHDLERVLDLTGHFKIPASVCVNKWDLNPDMTEKIESLARIRGATVAGRVRYDPTVTRAQIEVKSAVEYGGAASEDIRALWKNLNRSGGKDEIQRYNG